MKKFVSNLLWREPGVRISPLAHIFWGITLVFGVAFTFLTGDPSVAATVLFKLTTVKLGGGVVAVWGVAALVTSVLNLLGVGLRIGWLGNSAAFLGVSVWLYAAIAYVSGLYWLQLLTGALPNLVFWVMYYLNRRQHDE